MEVCKKIRRFFYTDFKYFLKKNIYLVPFFNLAYSLSSAYYRYTCGDTVVKSNLFGYSLLCCLVYIHVYFFTSSKYCYATKYAVFGMIIINVFSMTKKLLNLQIYTFWFQVIILSIVLGISVYLKIKDL